jgi:hypothetical protein
MPYYSVLIRNKGECAERGGWRPSLHSSPSPNNKRRYIFPDHCLERGLGGEVRKGKIPQQTKPN